MEARIEFLKFHQSALTQKMRYSKFPVASESFNPP